MRFFAFLCALMFWSSSSQAQNVIDYTFRLSQINGVKVVLTDDAKGACWTNLKEVREYVEEKLRMKGVTVLADNTPIGGFIKIYQLSIGVIALRLYQNGTGPCFGGIRVNLETASTIDGKFHNSLIADHFVVAAKDQNLNRDVILSVGEMIDELQR